MIWLRGNYFLWTTIPAFDLALEVSFLWIRIPESAVTCVMLRLATRSYDEKRTERVYIM